MNMKVKVALVVVALVLVFAIRHDVRIVTGWALSRPASGVMPERWAGDFFRPVTLWVVDPAHPIVEGMPDYFELPNTEMYGEPFGIPKPDDLVFISWFQGGEVFRSGCCWHRERGRVFYFRPGHETFPIYHNADVQRVIYNAVRWAAPVKMAQAPVQGNAQPLEPMP